MSRRAVRRARAARACRAALAILALTAGARAAGAQATFPRGPGFPVLIAPDRAVPRPMRPGPPLTPAQSERLVRARAMRESGRFDAAKASFEELLAEVPHHPIVLADIARVHEARGAWRAIEALGRRERAATKDSVLLAGELALALERLDHPRDAAQVAVEAWVTDVGAAPWAAATLTRLASADAKGVREIVRRAAEKRPDREDMARVAARLEWQGGDGAAAMRLLVAADRGTGTPLRWSFADERLAAATAADTSGALEALLSLASDTGRDPAYRLPAARRVWQIATRRGTEADAAARLTKSLQDLPPERWGQELSLPVARALRRSGRTTEARALMADLGKEGGTEVAIEKALAELRDGPGDKALAALAAAARLSPEGGFHYAEGLFFAGQSDSALAWYQRVAADPKGSRTGAALERIYLLEDAEPREALPLVGRLAFEQWRGEPKRALPLADSLYRTLGRGPLWAHAALALAELREATGDGKGAIEPLLAVAEKAPDDRLAPLARQRAGDVYRLWHKDDAKALAQYEECLARYPRAWNAAEVRRMVETMRRERRF